MQKSLFSISVFAFLCSFSVAHATDYNYLPADVGIKQQETLSALEYRLQTLESSLLNGGGSITLIESRIQQLKDERDTEKRYVTGTYGGYGIGDQLPTKLAEIDAKYAKQIADLESQKTSAQSSSDLRAKETEIAELKLRIKQLEYDLQTPEYEKAIQNPKPQATIYDLFNWLESLPDDEEVAQYKLLKSMNPENAYKIELLYREKYPNFFTQKEQKVITQTIPTTVQKKIETPKPVEKKSEIKIEATTTVNTPIPVVEEIKIPEMHKETIVQKVLGFFKKIVFWR